MLVDDMRPALRELEFLLKKYPDISIAGMYIDPLTAIEKIGELKPEVVFLDINMPQLQGIDAASRILDASPATDIVFVTAFDQYAVEAFELHALDYLLKPIAQERLEKTINRLRKENTAVRDCNSSKLKIRCFGRFQLGWEDREPVRWRIEKAKELFVYLLQNHNRSISKDELMDKLWPEEDSQRAIKLLYNGIYYIRKALDAYGIDRTLICISNNYNLQLGPVNWDVERFYELVTASGDKPEVLEEIEALYEGDYLEGEFYPWSDFEREKLSKLYGKCAFELAAKYVQGKEYDKAERILLKAYNKNPYSEELSLLLLKLYREAGDKNSAIRHYNAYSALIREELGIMPDEKLRKLIK